MIGLKINEWKNDVAKCLEETAAASHTLIDAGSSPAILVAQSNKGDAFMRLPDERTSSEGGGSSQELGCKILTNQDRSVAPLKTPGKVLSLPPTVLTDSADVIRRTLRQLGVPADEIEAATRHVFDETLRLLPRFLAVATISSQLGRLAARAARTGQREGMSRDDADDFGQSVALKIANQLYGRWPHGNAGAWVSMVARNLGIDNGRKSRSWQTVMDRLREAARRFRT